MKKKVKHSEIMWAILRTNDRGRSWFCATDFHWNRAGAIRSFMSGILNRTWKEERKKLGVKAVKVRVEVIG